MAHIYDECPTCGCEDDYETIYKCKECNHIYCKKCGSHKKNWAGTDIISCPHCGAQGGFGSLTSTVLGYESDKTRHIHERKEKEHEQQERGRQQQVEEEEVEEENARLQCPYCGQKTQEEFAVKLYGKNFHSKCKEEYINTETGKKWIKKQEEIRIIEEKRIEELKRKKEEERKYQEWLQSDEGKKWTDDQARIKAEELRKEREERERIDQERVKAAELEKELEKQRIAKETEEKRITAKTKKRNLKNFQIYLKLPVFIITASFSINYISLEKVSNSGWLKYLIAICIFGFLLLVYMTLGFCLSASYDGMCNYSRENNYTYTLRMKILSHLMWMFIGLLICAIIYFIVFKLIFKV